MPLAWPPLEAGSLARFPGNPMRGRTIFRVWRYDLTNGATRDTPWWFASAPPDPEEGGRYDLPAPLGSCHTATRPVAAVLEALQSRLVNLPVEELRVRRLATIQAPRDAPRCALLTSTSGAGRHGITAAMWAGGDRAVTQAWAAAFRRDGWWALYGGVQHDPSGRLRGHTLFDHAGEHEPTHGQDWPHQVTTLHDDADLHADLQTFGVTVREPGDLPWADRSGGQSSSGRE